jgi:hypothetical protein
MKARTKWMGMAAMGAVAVVVAAQANALPGGDVVSKRLNARTLEKSLNGEFLAPLAMIANNRNQWNRLMAELEAQGALRVLPARNAQELEQSYGVQWGKESVILVSLGELPTLSTDLEVVEVRRAIGKHLQVRVAVRVTDTPQQAVSAPYHLLVVEKGGWTGGEMIYDAPSGSPAAMPSRLATDDSRSDEPATQSVTLGAIKAAYR